MTKKEAAAIFSERGHLYTLAAALGIGRGALWLWPDELTPTQRDRVLGAAMRLRRAVPDAILHKEAA